jgi:hypothetical protein
METQAGRTTTPPYGPSSTIGSIKWEDAVLKIRQRAGDNWPIAWVDDELQITSYGDGGGFGPREPELTIGFARVYGDPPGHRLEDIKSDADVVAGYGRKGIKSSDMLIVGGTLYMWVRNYIPDEDPGNYTNARLGWSGDLGVTWTWAKWHFSQTFGCPAFVQFGKNYEGSRDEYVYVISQDNNDAYEYHPDIVMARVHKTRIADRQNYEFFTGLDSAGQPTWSGDIDRRKPVFTDPNGTQRVAMTFDAPIDRYLLVASHYPPGCELKTHSGALGIFEAPEPWGPWSTVYYDARWSNGFRTYHQRIPPKWISRDGTSFWLLYSGLDGGLYDFCLKQAHLGLA